MSPTSRGPSLGRPRKAVCPCILQKHCSQKNSIVAYSRTSTGNSSRNSQAAVSFLCCLSSQRDCPPPLDHRSCTLRKIAVATHKVSDYHHHHLHQKRIGIERESQKLILHKLGGLVDSVHSGRRRSSSNQKCIYQRSSFLSLWVCVGEKKRAKRKKKKKKKKKEISDGEQARRVAATKSLQYRTTR